jgi:hypothetical protein
VDDATCLALAFRLDTLAITGDVGSRGYWRIIRNSLAPHVRALRDVDSQGRA